MNIQLQNNESAIFNKESAKGILNQKKGLSNFKGFNNKHGF